MIMPAGPKSVVNGQSSDQDGSLHLYLVGAATMRDAETAENAAHAVRRHSKQRRMMTREQGHALETLGHAVDYLSDSELFLGFDDEEVLTLTPATDAIRILARVRQQLLQSLPLAEPLAVRLWKSIFHRDRRPSETPDQPPVVGLSLR